MLKQYYLPPIVAEMNKPNVFLDALKLEMDKIKRDIKVDLTKPFYGTYEQYLKSTNPEAVNAILNMVDAESGSPIGSSAARIAEEKAARLAEVKRIMEEMS